MKNGGWIMTSDVIPLAANLASLSAFSLPGIPQCPTIHLRVSPYLRLLLHLSIRFASSRNSHAK